jgi:hypothetical protein
VNIHRRFEASVKRLFLLTFLARMEGNMLMCLGGDDGGRGGRGRCTGIRFTGSVMNLALCSH